ncbi:TPA: hypothetical protein ACYU9H_000586 [Klebsiella pneumoniae]
MFRQSGIAAAFSKSILRSPNVFQSLAGHNINASSTLAGIMFTGEMFSQYGEYALMITMNNRELEVYGGITDNPETLLTRCPTFDYVMLSRTAPFLALRCQTQASGRLAAESSTVRFGAQ